MYEITLLVPSPPTLTTPERLDLASFHLSYVRLRRKARSSDMAKEVSRKLAAIRGSK